MSSIEDALQLYAQNIDVSPLISKEEALFDAEILLGHVLNCDRTYLKTWPEKIISNAQLEVYQGLIEQRSEGVPVAHLLGVRDFWTLELFVSPCTLIPRPDTEILIEHALEQFLPEDAKVLDLGTGTGAIALALARERPKWSVTASDVFPEVVALARKNALHNALENVSIVCSAWFEVFEKCKFHLIVSNPPYIDSLDPHLSQGDLRFEPNSALVAGDQGMADIRHIVETALNHMLPGGWLMIEHGYQQGERVRSVFVAKGYQQVKTIRDFGGNERVTMGCWGL